MGLEEQLLTASIEDTFRDAHMANVKLQHLYEQSNMDNIDHGDHANKLEDATEIFEYYIDKIFRDITILSERLGLPLLAREIVNSRRKITNLSALIPTRHDTLLHSKPLALARKFFESLESMTRGRGITGLGIFETILHNTPKIIESGSLDPSKESDVCNAVIKILGFCFRDVVRQIPISKNLKVYKPDIGVKSLMAAVEYKFINSKEDAKKALDELYADMKGYSGRYDWRFFYAVLYMTSSFYNQKDVEEEFRLVKAELSWTPIVVVGKGRQSRKSDKA